MCHLLCPIKLWQKNHLARRKNEVEAQLQQFVSKSEAFQLFHKQLCLWLQQFSTFGTAVNTCFAILLGDISVNDDLNQLQGLQGVAATLFFWSFELLVFMVLLNFLLAIIVDAFSEVKENTHETTGMHFTSLQLG